MPKQSTRLLPRWVLQYKGNDWLLTWVVTVAVQDASLLAMLRISRECEEIPIEVMSKVSSLAEFSGRHIKRVSSFLCL